MRFKFALVLIAPVLLLLASPVDAALSRNYLGRFMSTPPVGTAPFTTASMTPDASSILVAVVFSVSQGNVDYVSGLTITDSQSHTWTLRASGCETVNWHTCLQIYTAPNTPTTSFTIDVDAGAFDVHNYMVDVISYTGQHASPIGASLQLDNQASDGLLSVSLSGSPASTSEVVAALVGTASGTTSAAPGSGWTELDDDTESSWLGAESQIRTGSTSATVEWSDVDDGAGSFQGTAVVALEIIAADAGGPTCRGALLLLGVGGC